MGIGTVLGVVRSAAKIPGGITAHSEGAEEGGGIDKSGGRCDELFALTSAPYTRRCLRRGYVNLAQEHQNGHFCCFRPL